MVNFFCLTLDIHHAKINITRPAQPPFLRAYRNMFISVRNIHSSLSMYIIHLIEDEANMLTNGRPNMPVPAIRQTMLKYAYHDEAPFVRSTSYPFLPNSQSTNIVSSVIKRIWIIYNGIIHDRMISQHTMYTTVCRCANDITCLCDFDT